MLMMNASMMEVVWIADAAGPYNAFLYFGLGVHKVCKYS